MIYWGRLKSTWEMDGVTCWLESEKGSVALEDLLERCNLLWKSVV